MKVLTVSQMREYDRLATVEFGIPSLMLMENAGRNVAEIVDDYIFDAELYLPRVVVICGPGNNGGDGFVAARHLHNYEKCQVRILQLVADDRYSGDAEVNRRIVEKIGIPIVKLTGEGEDDISKVKKELKKADIIIDGILGTGIRGEVKGFLREVIDCLRDYFSAYVISIDIPSGICGDTGRIMGSAVRADETVTFGYAKAGALLDTALDYVGLLHVTDISLPPNLENIEPPFIESPEEEEMAEYFPDRPRAAHKGNFGHLLVVGGCDDLRGAPLLAGEAALKAGVGLVTIAGIPSVTAPVVTKSPDIMTHNLIEESGHISPKSVAEILKQSENKSAVVLGCGLGRGEGVTEVVAELVMRMTKPLLIDADGLNALAQNVSLLKKRTTKELIITPHPGEMARLMDIETADVQRDRINVAREFAREYGVTVVLKGARSIIADSGGTLIINPTGTPGMAVGGMGDVLAGVGGGLLAQGLMALDAMKAGCFIAGLAGEILAEESSEISVTASELIKKIPDAILAIKG
ncbi:MAG: NAD(P)H-hydrate dehydratase [Myxococcota bacterium]